MTTQSPEVLPINGLLKDDTNVLLFLRAFLKPQWFQSHGFSLYVPGHDRKKANDTFIKACKKSLSDKGDDEIFTASEDKRRPTFIVATKDIAFTGFSYTKKDFEDTEMIEFEAEVVIHSIAGYTKLCKLMTDKSFVEYKYGGVSSKLDVDGDPIYNCNISTFYLDATGMQMDSYNEMVSTADLKEIRYDFYPGINVPLLMKQYFASDSNILVLSSEPGTGKTSLMRRALADFSIQNKSGARGVYVKDPRILERDEFYGRLKGMNPDFLLLDDMNHGLKLRALNEPGSVVEKLLSFSNGLFKNKIKIIITTNRGVTGIDDAIIRPGRGLDVLEIPFLTRDQAKAIWTDYYKHPLSAFDEKLGAGDMVPQANLATHAKEYAQFETQSYLIDPSISIRDKVIAASKEISEGGENMLSNKLNEIASTKKEEDKGSDYYSKQIEQAVTNGHEALNKLSRQNQDSFYRQPMQAVEPRDNNSFSEEGLIPSAKRSSYRQDPAVDAIASLLRR